MKKIILILSLALLTLVGFSQVNKQILQVADTSKVFATNKMIGDFIDIKTYPTYLFKLNHTVTAMQTVGYALRQGWCDTIGGSGGTSVTPTLQLVTEAGHSTDVHTHFDNGILVAADSTNGINLSVTGGDNVALSINTNDANSIPLFVNSNTSDTLAYFNKGNIPMLFINGTGATTTPNLTISQITTSGGKTLVTKDYADSLVNGSSYWSKVGNKLYTSTNDSVGIGKVPTAKLDVNGDALINGITVGTKIFDSDNVAIGKNSLKSYNQPLSGEGRNIAIGSNTLYKNILGFGNIAIGTMSLYENTSNLNVAIGTNTLWQSVAGTGNTAIGHQSMSYRNVSGSNNTSVGKNSGYYNTQGTNNTCIGNLSLYYNISGNYNIAIGDSAGYGNVSGFTALSKRMYLGSKDSTDVGIYFDRTSTKKWGRWNGNLKVTGKYTQGEVAKVTIDTVSAIRLLGNTTVWKDVEGSFSTGLSGGSSYPTYVVDSGYYTFTVDTTAPTICKQYFPSIQLNHEFKLGATVYPHVHYKHETAKGTPTFIVRYRWKNIGSAPTAWNWCKMNTTTGTTNGTLQLAYSTIGMSAVGNGISAMLQAEVYLFSQTGTGGINAYGFDLHCEVDSMGSNGITNKD